MKIDRNRESRSIVVNLFVFLICFSGVFDAYSLWGMSLLDFVISISSIFLLFSLLLRGKIYKKTLFVICVVVLAIFSMSFSLGGGEVLGHMRKMLIVSKGLFVVVNLVYWVDSIYRVRVAIYGLVSAGVIAVGGAFLQGYLGVEWVSFADETLNSSRIPSLGVGVDIPRSVGFVSSHGMYGSYVEAAGLILCIGFIGHAREKYNITIKTAIFGVLLLIIGVLMSQSRSGLVASLVGLFSVYILSIYNYSTFLSFRSIPLFIVALGLIFIGVEAFTRLIEVGREAVSRRLLGYYVAFQAFVENPVTGVGFGDVKGVLGVDHIIHNTYLSIAAQGGMFSIATFLFIFAMAIYYGGQCLDHVDYRAPIAIVLLSTLIAHVVELNLYNGASISITYIPVGLLIALGNLNRY